MQRKDPNRLWYWVVVVICMIGILPVFFLGKVGPLILGIPLWVVVSLISTVILTVVTLIQLRFGWSIAVSGTRQLRSTDDE
jgi:hypothetical protein